MNTKVMPKMMIVIGLLVVAFFAVEIAFNTSAMAPAGVDAAVNRNLAGSDWIERHPAVATNPDYLVGSDWIERDLSGMRVNSFAGSDYSERHPLVIKVNNTFAGSDYTERHPAVANVNDYFAGSDFFERHPSNYFTGSDWIERQP